MTPVTAQSRGAFTDTRLLSALGLETLQSKGAIRFKARSWPNSRVDYLHLCAECHRVLRSGTFDLWPCAGKDVNSAGPGWLDGQWLTHATAACTV